MEYYCICHLVIAVFYSAFGHLNSALLFLTQLSSFLTFWVPSSHSEVASPCTLHHTL